MSETNQTPPTITVDQLTTTLMVYADELSASISDELLCTLLCDLQGHLLNRYRVLPVAMGEDAGPSPE